jgi:hypothetical protein
MSIEIATRAMAPAIIIIVSVRSSKPPGGLISVVWLVAFGSSIHARITYPPPLLSARLSTLMANSYASPVFHSPEMSSLISPPGSLLEPYVTLRSPMNSDADNLMSPSGSTETLSALLLLLNLALIM